MMHTLIPLHLDTSTGRTVASNTSTTTGGLAGGFEFVVTVASTVWYIEHNANLTTLICQAYDNVGEYVIPDVIRIVDSNTVEILFNVAMAGTANIIFFG